MRRLPGSNVLNIRMVFQDFLRGFLSLVLVNPRALCQAVIAFRWPAYLLLSC